MAGPAQRPLRSSKSPQRSQRLLCMPVYSMTGYASAQHSPGTAAAGHEGGKLATPARLGLEIRSVNSRFLDLSFRLGEELRAHEPGLRELITGRIKRGKVEVRANVEGTGTEVV